MRRLLLALTLIATQVKTNSPEKWCSEHVPPIPDGLYKGNKWKSDIADCRIDLLEKRVAELEKRIAKTEEAK